MRLRECTHCHKHADTAKGSYIKNAFFCCQSHKQAWLKARKVQQCKCGCGEIYMKGTGFNRGSWWFATKACRDIVIGKHKYGTEGDAEHEAVGLVEGAEEFKAERRAAMMPKAEPAVETATGTGWLSLPLVKRAEYLLAHGPQLGE